MQQKKGNAQPSISFLASLARPNKVERFDVRFRFGADSRLSALNSLVNDLADRVLATGGAGIDKLLAIGDTAHVIGMTAGSGFLDVEKFQHFVHDIFELWAMRLFGVRIESWRDQMRHFMNDRFHEVIGIFAHQHFIKRHFVLIPISDICRFALVKKIDGRKIGVQIPNFVGGKYGVQNRFLAFGFGFNSHFDLSPFVYDERIIQNSKRCVKKFFQVLLLFFE